MEFNAEILAIVAFIVFFAAFIHGSIGFGFPMVATPLLTLVTDIQSAIILTLIPTLLVNIVSISSEGGFLAALRRYFPLALLAMIGSALGTLILIFTNSEIFEALLAIAILVYLLSERIKLKLAWIKEYPQLSRLVFGILAGILGGLTNVMAPVLIIYSLELKYSKSEIIQASNFCFLFGKIIQLVLFSIHDKFNVSEFSTSLILLIFVSFALFLGVNIKKKIRGNAYKKILRAFLLLLAIMLLLNVVT